MHMGLMLLKVRQAARFSSLLAEVQRLTAVTETAIASTPSKLPALTAGLAAGTDARHAA
jgi:hypothetical protein